MRLLFLLLPFLSFASEFSFWEGSSYERFLSLAERARVIYLGETHDRKDIHEFQLRVMKDLHSKGYSLIILMEAFQQQFQDALDEYIDGEIDEEEMLKRTEYYRRWRFDKELYAPLWRFAKEKGIRLFALNIPSELLREIRERGIEEVKSHYLPKKLMPFRRKHREFLRKAMGKHKIKDEKHFFDIQLAWDMGMAFRIAKVALFHPEEKLVVIVGSGHVWEGSGIPERVNFLLGEIPQLVSFVDEDYLYFLFSRDFSRESSSANSRREPN